MFGAPTSQAVLGDSNFSTVQVSGGDILVRGNGIFVEGYSTFYVFETTLGTKDKK